MAVTHNNKKRKQINHIIRFKEDCYDGMIGGTPHANSYLECKRLRPPVGKGLSNFIDKMNTADVDVAEVGCLPKQLPKDWKVPEGYEMILHPAEKKGYSGVATLSKGPMKEQGRGMKNS